MTIRIIPPPGDIFASGASAIVIPVNCVGACGRGLAKEAARRWPAWARAYRADLASEEFLPGDVCCHLMNPVPGGPAFPLSFFTKGHWRSPSHLVSIERGLPKLAAWCRGAAGSLSRGVAVPALGCGEGGLAWDDVLPLMERALAPEKVDFMVYAPHPARGRR